MCPLNMCFSPIFFFLKKEVIVNSKLVHLKNHLLRLSSPSGSLLPFKNLYLSYIVFELVESLKATEEHDTPFLSLISLTPLMVRLEKFQNFPFCFLQIYPHRALELKSIIGIIVFLL